MRTRILSAILATIVAIPALWWEFHSIHWGSKLLPATFSWMECLASFVGALAVVGVLVAADRLIKANYGIEETKPSYSVYALGFGFSFLYGFVPDLLAATFHQIGAFSNLTRGFLLVALCTIHLVRSRRNEEQQKQLRTLLASKFMIVFTLVMAARRRSKLPRFAMIVAFFADFASLRETLPDAAILSQMGDKKPKKTSSGNHDKHSAKSAKSPFMAPTEAPKSDKGKDKKK